METLENFIMEGYLMKKDFEFVTVETLPGIKKLYISKDSIVVKVIEIDSEDSVDFYLRDMFDLEPCASPNERLLNTIYNIASFPEFIESEAYDTYIFSEKVKVLIPNEDFGVAILSVSGEEELKFRIKDAIVDAETVLSIAKKIAME